VAPALGNLSNLSVDAALYLSIHGGRVANAHGCNASWVRAPASAIFLRFIFSNRYRVSDTEGLKMVCVTLWNLLQPRMSAVL